MNMQTNHDLGRCLRDFDETDLVIAARKQGEEAIRELIRRLNPRLFRVARGILASDAEAEEVVQEAYLHAFTNLDRFRGDARFSTWITRIALNTARMRRRSNRPHQELDTVNEAEAASCLVLPFPGLQTDQPDAALGRSQVRGLLEQAIADLPEDFRLVFLLREVEGMSVLAIARDLDLNPITVKTRLFRARRRLRARLESRLRGGFELVFPFGGQRCRAMADRVVSALSRLKSR